MNKNNMQKPPRLEKRALKIAFIPIICSAPLIYAHSHGYFEKNGLDVELVRPPGWSGIKELLVYGYVDAAHMLSPMPLACSLGIDGKKADIRLATVQNVNGQALTLANRHLGIKDVRDMKGFTFGVPYRFSMHYYLLCYYLAANGINPLKDVTIKEVAPPTMPFHLKKGWVDGIFAPEPFNQIPVYQNLGFIHILSRDIWPGHPCCSLATSQDFIDRYPNTYQVMLKSVLKAELALHNADAEQRKEIAREISGPLHLNQDDPTPVEQSLAGDFPDGKGGHHRIPDRIDFIPYPWEEYGIWMISQMQRWAQLPGKVDYREVVESVFETKGTRELAGALGFTVEDKPNLNGIYPFTGKDAFTYMSNQPYCTFQEEAKPLAKVEISEKAFDFLSEISKYAAAVTGGNLDEEIEINADGKIGQLQQLLNEMILNLKFNRDNLIEQNEKLEVEVAERKQAERELETHREHLELINHILRHDVLNDLTAVKSALRLYESSNDEKFLKEAPQYVDRGVETIRRMRELESFISSHKDLEFYDIKAVIKEVIEHYGSIEFTIEGKGQVLADDALGSVIDNIIRNAIEHGKTHRIDITIDKQGNFCEVRIADHGVGIPDKIKAQVFKKDFRYGETGHTGLGLHIVKKAMESYGGIVHIEDNIPKGTIFVLKLRRVR